MKRYLLIAAIALFSAPSFAQKSNAYCDLNVYKPWFKNYIAIPDYGTTHKKATMTNSVKDNNGNTMKFVSEIDALNYMVKQGWELVSIFRDHGNETHFYLKKTS